MPAPRTWRATAIGFGSSVREGDDKEAIKRLFTPEFRNRLDAVDPFGHLPPAVVRKVVEKFVLQLEAQLAERQINIELSSEAADWLATKGYDQQMGARPLARVIQEHVKKPLAEEVLFGKLAKGGTVRILLEGRRAALRLSEPRRGNRPSRTAGAQGIAARHLRG